MNSEFMQWKTRIIYYRRNTFKRRGIYSYFAAANNITILIEEKKHGGKTQMVDITFYSTFYIFTYRKYDMSYAVDRLKDILKE